MPKVEATVTEVRAHRTRSGNTRFVVVDESGREYTTFREEVAAQLEGIEGRRARLEYHEQRRGNFTNVYLDAVEPLEATSDAGGPTEDAERVAWGTAIEAAPYLLPAEAVEEEVPAEELFEKLHPFKELVADDIEGKNEG
jgi:hypothetical protein